MTTKIIKLKSWELLREVTENNKRWAYFVGMENQLWEEPHDQSIDQLFYRLFGKYDVALVDDSIPEINWDDFDWDFFDQYGGILGTSSSGAEIVLSKRSLVLHIDSPTLRETPFYYWTNTSQYKYPVPDNVEVEVVMVPPGYRRHQIMAACEVPWNDMFIVAFRLTGNVL